MKTIIAVVGVLISVNAMSKTPEEAPPAASPTAPVSLLGYAIGQKLDACPEGSKTVVREHRKLCSLGPTTFAGTRALDHSITLFNGQVIGIRIGVRGQAANPQVLAHLRDQFGDPDGSFSKPDLHSYIWVRGSVVVHFDGVVGAIQINDVLMTEVAKLRIAPTNQFDF
jgi:hypothetical protein